MNLDKIVIWEVVKIRLYNFISRRLLGDYEVRYGFGVLFRLVCVGFVRVKLEWEVSYTRWFV